MTHVARAEHHVTEALGLIGRPTIGSDSAKSAAGRHLAAALSALTSARYHAGRFPADQPEGGLVS